MPVEFSCPGCQQRLQTPDGSQGKPTRCPSCGHSFEIPWTEETGPATTPLPPAVDRKASPDETENPFSAPATVSELPAAADLGELTYRRIFARDILSVTWETVRTQTGQCLLLGLLFVAIYGAGYIVSFVLGSLTSLISAPNANQPLQMIAAVVVFLAQVVWGQIYGAFLAAVAIRYALNVLRGSREPIQGVFDVLPLLLRVILVQFIIGLLAGLVVGAAAVLFAVPMFVFSTIGQGPPLVAILLLVVLVPLALVGWIIVWVRFSVALPLVIDRNLGVFESLSESLRYTRGNTGSILGATAGVSVLVVLFTLLTCGIGAVLSMPAWIIFRGVVYLLVTDQLDMNEGTVGNRMANHTFARNASTNPFADDVTGNRSTTGPISPGSPFQ